MILSVGEHLIIFSKDIYFWEVCCLGDFGIGFVVFVYTCSLNSLGTAPDEG